MLTVTFTLGGTAALNSDYSCSQGAGATALTCSAFGQITFAAGSSSAQLVVDPTPDTAVEGVESVVVNMTSGAGYSVGNPSSATGTIDDSTTPGFEADLAARPLGDGVLRSNDVEAARAIIAGDPVNTSTNEFQRADVAPYETQGDGLLRANDLQLVKNYVAVLVGPQPAGGPAAALGRGAMNEIADEKADGRTMRVVSSKAAAGGKVSVAVEIDALGDEVVSLFSLRFDGSMLMNPVVTLGDEVPEGTALTVNVVDDGSIVVLIDSSDAFARGVSARVVNITFDIAKDVPIGETAITFDGSGSFSDAAGRSLGAFYQDGSVTVVGRMTRGVKP